jgi:hypothetical protein
MKPLLKFTVIVALATSGCAAPKDKPKNAPVDKGQYNTTAYNIAIDASEPNTRIEVNYKILGTAPVTVKVYGDKDGTFHRFDEDEFIVRAYPAATNFYPQTKVFKTGAFGIKDDKIPEKIFFQLDPIKP